MNNTESTMNETTPETIATMAREVAAALGLDVKITATQASSSDKLGRQIRVRVACSDKSKTWAAMRSIGWEIGQKIEGRVFQAKGSHVETRIGNHGGCRGFVTGSAAAFRVYPDARA